MTVILNTTGATNHNGEFELAKIADWVSFQDNGTTDDGYWLEILKEKKEAIKLINARFCAGTLMGFGCDDFDALWDIIDPV